MSSKQNPELSIVIPCYNESVNIPDTLLDIKKYLRDSGIYAEIIVVDDGSKDDTADKVKLIAETFPEVQIVSHFPNQGKGYSIKEGMMMATGKNVIFMDADNSTNIREYDRFRAYLSEYDMIIASRGLKSSKVIGKPASRSIMSRVSKYFTILFTGLKYQDTQCGFKLIKGEYVKPIFRKVTINRWWFDTEILIIAEKMDLKIKELGVEWVAGKTTTVKPVKDTLRTLRDLVIIRRNMILGKYDSKK